MQMPDDKLDRREIATVGRQIPREFENGKAGYVKAPSFPDDDALWVNAPRGRRLRRPLSS